MNFMAENGPLEETFSYIPFSHNFWRKKSGHRVCRIISVDDEEIAAGQSKPKIFRFKDNSLLTIFKFALGMKVSRLILMMSFFIMTKSQHIYSWRTYLFT